MGTWTQCGANVVPDSGFESWDDATNLTYWGHSSNYMAQETVDVHAGTYSLKLNHRTSTYTWDIYQDNLDYPDYPFQLIEGQTYMIDLWHKHSDYENSSLYFRFQAYDPTENGGDWNQLNMTTGEWEDSLSHLTIDGVADWTNFTLRFEALTGALKYEFTKIYCDYNAGAGDYLLLDDVQIYPVVEVEDEATLYFNSDEKTLSIAEKTYVYAMGGGGDRWRPMLCSASESFEWSRGGWYRLYADDGKAIGGYWTSKRLDFGDQFPQYTHWFKTLDTVRVEYVDEIADTPLTVGISKDGGVNWAYKTQLVGTGDGTQKIAEFRFRDSEYSTAKYFNVRIESVSTTTTFTWTGLFIDFEPRGEWFEI